MGYEEKLLAKEPNYQSGKVLNKVDEENENGTKQPSDYVLWKWAILKLQMEVRLEVTL